jgi:hypothetical protein
MSGLRPGGREPDRRNAVIATDWQPRRIEQLRVGQTAGGYVAYTPRSDRIHFLNHTGAAILDLCDGRNTIVEICGRVRQEYELEEDPLEDVRACLEVLLQEGLIQ